MEFFFLCSILSELIVVQELMSKCGVIQRDARTNKLKIKIYRGEEGEPKGDARCGYVKVLFYFFFFLLLVLLMNVVVKGCFKIGRCFGMKN